MHRTGVDGAGGCGGLGFGRRKESFRLGPKPRAATARAEEIILPPVRKTMRRGLRIDAHATHGIDDGCGGRFAIMLPTAAGLTRRFGRMMMAAAGRRRCVRVVQAWSRHQNSLRRS